MTRWTLCAAIAAAFVAAPATAAVTLNPGGLGQGLLFPYFSTNNEQTTLLNVQNTSTKGKALKVRVLESHAGAETLTFNVYLGPGGTWSTALAQTDTAAGAFATLLRADGTCTTPAIPESGQDLLPFGFQGDGGPQTGERSREGLIEIVEMGELSTALSDAAGTAANCGLFSSRFSDGGAWATDPNTDLSAPAGGIRGNAIIIDTADGTAFNYSALAFDGLAVAPRQFRLSVTLPAEQLLPRLTDVQVADGEDVEVNLIDATGAPVTLRYDATEGYNAISALLANHSASSSFNVDAGLRARTEWIYSFPTRRAHNGSIVVGTPPPGVPAPPFAGTTGVCETVSVTLAERSGVAGASEALDLCGAAGVVRFAADGLDTAPIVALDDDAAIEASFAAGSATFDFSQIGDDARTSLPDLDGHCFTGLPVWAMAVSAYDNDNAQAGRIATFPVEEVASRVSNIVDCSND